MKKLIHNGQSYSLHFVDYPDGTLLEIITVNSRASVKIERPSLIELAKQAHDAKDFGVYEIIFKTLGNQDIAGMELI